jgi:hypothetical protein
MKKNKIKDDFFAELMKVPIVQVACEKTGISRNSVYRWRKEDKSFSAKMDQALADGVALVNDMTENQLLVLIKEKNYPAISFWLRHRNDNYKNKVEITGALNTINELSPEQEILVKQALSLAGVETYEENKQESN